MTLTLALTLTLTLTSMQARALAIRVIKERLSVVGESRADKRVVLNRRVLHRAMMLKIVPEDQAVSVTGRVRV